MYSAVLAFAVLCAAANLWGTLAIFESFFTVPTPKAAASFFTRLLLNSSGFTIAQALSCLSAFIALAMHGRQLFRDRQVYTDKVRYPGPDADVRGDAGFALEVATCILSLLLVVRAAVIALLERAAAARRSETPQRGGAGAAQAATAPQAGGQRVAFASPSGVQLLSHDTSPQGRGGKLSPLPVQPDQDTPSTGMPQDAPGRRSVPPGQDSDADDSAGRWHSAASSSVGERAYV
jgi:hypothetical protein